MSQFISKSEEDTINFAYKLASKLHTGDIIVLSGELGSRENEIYSRNFKIFQPRK